MNKLMILFQREWWEHRSGVVRVYTVIAGLFFVFALCATVFAYGFNFPLASLRIQSYQALPAIYLREFAVLVSVPFSLIMYLLMFNYFLSCLYDDRKDRSILFWQSMPIAQWQSLLSKTLFGVIVIPVVSLCFVVVTELVLLFFLALLLSHFVPGSPSILLNLPGILFGWIDVLSHVSLHVMLLFPLFAWCMFCSARAKKAPFLYAITAPLMIMILEWFFDSKNLLFHFIGNRLGYYYRSNQIFSHYSMNGTLELLVVGMTVGIAFIVWAGYLRSHCYDFE